MKTKITKMDALRMCNDLKQYLNGLSYDELSQTLNNDIQDKIDYIRLKIQLVKE